ncbi:MAG: efflux RND transporter periplasmic adaptor subunit [Pseudomonadales bacterium]|nr:efflux RND transporter periplasmic adaptor subunit [Pseudomonadales bacterium]
MKRLMIESKGIWSIVATLGFFAVLIWALSGPAADEQQTNNQVPALSVTVVEVQPTRKSLTVEALGLSQARWPTSVIATVSGRVESIHDHSNPGSLLNEDTVLVRLQDELYRAELAQAQAQLAQAELQLAQVKNEQYVVTELKESTSAFGRREPHVKAAQAQLSAVQAMVENAEQQLANTTVSVPFDAIVVNESVSPGQWINAGDELFRIASSESVDISVELSADQWRRLGQLNGQQPINVVTPGGKQWQANIRYISPELNPITRQRSLVLSVENPYSRVHPLLPYQQVRVHIAGRTISNVVEAPATTLTEDGNVWSVVEGVLVQESIEILTESSELVLFRFQQAPERTRSLVRFPTSSMLSGQRVVERFDVSDTGELRL